MNKQEVQQIIKNKQANITCFDCKQEFQFQAERRNAGDGLHELGIRCPLCDTWYHSYFITDGIIKMPRNNREQLRAYKAQLKRLNKRERKQRGLRKDNGRWVNASGSL